PFVFVFLVLPYGISSGFVSITLPFVLTRVGFSVALAASIVAIRRVGKSLAISLGTGGGPDFDRAPLVFVGTWHVRGDALASCLSIAPSKHRRDFDGSCFCFASCGNIDRSSGRWVDGAYGRRGSKRSRGWLVSGGKSRRQWHRRWRRRLACQSFLEGDRRRRTRDRHARVGCRDCCCIRRARRCR